jgi:hypothetical protein
MSARFVIQKETTGLYFGRGLKWTANPDEALAFVNEIRARDFSIYRRMGVTAVFALADNVPLEAAPVLPER